MESNQLETNSMSPNQILCFCVLLIGLSNLSSAAPTENEFVRAAMIAQQQFSKAIIEGRFIEASRMLGDLSENSPKEVAKHFIQENLTRRQSGVRLIKESIRKAEYFTDGKRHAVFLRMTAIYEHPLASNGQTEEKYTLVALSESGNSWSFPGYGCFSEASMKSLFMNYNGTPSFTENE